MYVGDGMFADFGFKYNKPAKEFDINKFIEEGVIIPEDYKDFLLITNGISFYDTIDSLFAIEEVIALKEELNFKEGIYPIGYVLEDYIVIKSDEVSTGEYIYVGDSYCCDEYFPLHTDFINFIDRLFITGGSNYWRWQTPTKKYNFIKN